MANAHECIREHLSASTIRRTIWSQTPVSMLDGDPDIEDGGDTDWSGYGEELPTSQWSGEGVAKALRLIEASPAASKRADEYADTPRPPLIYDFRGGAGR